MAYAMASWMVVAIALYKISLADHYALSLPMLILGTATVYFGYSIILQFLIPEQDSSADDSLWGLQECFSGEPSDKDAGGISIIFVHGLGSSPARTWTARGAKKTFSSTNDRFDWITSLLTPQIWDRLGKTSKGGLHVYHYNYESKWMYAASQGRLRLYGQRLQLELRRIMAKKDERVVLIGHSFGGLVIKEALTLPHEEDFLGPRKIAGIMFLGTPHLGSKFALLGLCVTLVFLPLKPDLSAMIGLLSESTNLQDLHDNFITKHGGTPMRNFWESEPAILRICGIEITRAHVVSQKSATFSHRGTLNIMLKADHSGLNKFNCEGDNYRQFRDQLFELLDVSTSLHVSNPTSSRNSKATGSSSLFETPLLAKNTSRSSEVWTYLSDPSVKTHMAKHFQEAADGRHPSTCLWIEDHTSKLHWLKAQKEPSLLWLTGNMLCGKTTLCAYLIQRLTIMSQPSTTPILYAFCNPNYLVDEAQILGVIIDQFIDAVPKLKEMALPDLSEAAEKYFSVEDWYDKGGPPQNLGPNRPHQSKAWPSKNADFLWSVFTILFRLAEPFRVYLIIDGLDTLTHDVSVKFISNVRRHVMSLQCCDIKLIFSNRSNVEHIRNQILMFDKSKYKCVELDDSHYVKNDIQTYLTIELQRIGSFRCWPSSTIREMPKKVGKICSDMFLYANFIVKRLELSPSYMIESVLSMQLGDLGQLYGQALSGIAPLVQARQSNILLCLLYSYRPLTLSEVFGALSSPNAKLNAEARAGLLHDIMLHGPLLKFDAKNETVGFVHPTAKDYLLQQANAEQQPHSPFLPNRRVGHEALAEGCLRYLISKCNREYPGWWSSHINKEKEKINQRYPVVWYAFTYWHDHYRQALSDKSTIAATDKLLRLLRELDQLRLNGLGSSSFWSFLVQECPDPHSDGRNYFNIKKNNNIKKNIHDITSVEFFAFCGIPDAVVMALERNNATKSQAVALQNQEKALVLALSSRHPQTVSILLKHFNTRSLDGPAYKLFIPELVRAGKPDLLGEVISMRPSRSIGELAQALYEAVYYQDAASARTILNSIDVRSEKDDNGMTILHWMFWRFVTQDMLVAQSLDVLNAAILVLSKGADINAQDHLGNTILHYIAYSYMSHETVLRRLIARGANPEIANKFGWLPIHLLVRKSTSILAIRYLERCNPRMLHQTTRGKSTVLHWAVQRSHNQNASGLIIKYLLCRGLMLDAPNRRGVAPVDVLRTDLPLMHALWMACSSPSSYTVDNVHGARVNMAIEDGVPCRTAVLLLTEDGFDADNQDDSDSDSDDVDEKIREGNIHLASQALHLGPEFYPVHLIVNGTTIADDAVYSKQIPGFVVEESDSESGVVSSANEESGRSNDADRYNRPDKHHDAETHERRLGGIKWRSRLRRIARARMV